MQKTIDGINLTFTRLGQYLNILNVSYGESLEKVFSDEKYKFLTEDLPHLSPKKQIINMKGVFKETTELLESTEMKAILKGLSAPPSDTSEVSRLLNSFSNCVANFINLLKNILQGDSSPNYLEIVIPNLTFIREFVKFVKKTEVYDVNRMIDLAKTLKPFCKCIQQSGPAWTPDRSSFDRHSFIVSPQNARESLRYEQFTDSGRIPQRPISQSSYLENQRPISQSYYPENQRPNSQNSYPGNQRQTYQGKPDTASDFNGSQQFSEQATVDENEELYNGLIIFEEYIKNYQQNPMSIQQFVELRYQGDHQLIDMLTSIFEKFIEFKDSGKHINDYYASLGLSPAMFQPLARIFTEYY